MVHDACICTVIGIVKVSQARCVMDMNKEVTKLKNTNPTLAAKKRSLLIHSQILVHGISCGYIVRMLLNAISTYKVGKNWNSHGATLG